jgi:7,8-didemethyl-8-hydroxy-5-deazariboflavin synthase CofG subunit
MGKIMIVGSILSASVVLTRGCQNACAYCTFRGKRPTLLPTEELRERLSAIGKTGATEVVFLAGEAPQEFPEIMLALHDERCGSFVDYVWRACDMALSEGLIPVLAIGYPDSYTLERLQDTGALMQFDVVPAPLQGEGEAHGKARTRTPSAARQAIESAHNARLAYRLRFLLGIGETAAERQETIVTTGRFCAADPYLQDITLVPFHPQPGTPWYDRPPLGFAEIKECVGTARREFPVHHLGVPPHLFSRCAELTEAGLNDLGAMPLITGDPVVPNMPVPSLELIKNRLLAANLCWTERLPLITPVALGHPALAEVIPSCQTRIGARNRAALQLIDNRECFVCGPRNPHGLHLTFHHPDENTCVTHWIAGPGYQGYAGIVHGGLLSTLLDEIMAQSLIGAGMQVVTADLRVRFLRPAPVGVPLQIKGTRTGQRARIHFTRGTVMTLDGCVLAEAEGRFAESSD